MIKKILVLSAFAIFTGASAQKTHTVGKGESPYGIAKKYGMSLEELVKLNPSAKSGQLKIGDKLIINKTAVEQKSDSEKPKASAGNVGFIILQPKQTVYGITKQYHITEADLRKLNPNLDTHLKIGDKVALPTDLISKYGNGQVVVNSETVKTVEKTAAPISPSQTTDENSYVVQPKDNYYRITKKYNLTQDQLFALNPGLEEKGLQPGNVIKVKGSTAATGHTTVKPQEVKNASASNTTSVTDDYVTYTVKDGDTVFGILNKYGITLDELLSLNPSLSGGLKSGMVLKIKKLDAQYIKTNGDALNVVLMLPFGFDTNDSKYRAMSTDFLTGAKLAVERNARLGQKLSINVIDAGNESSFKNSLTQINKDNTDLIIGPFFKSSVLEVLNYVGNTKIPVVAPFANSEDLYGYSNLIIVEPNDSVFTDKIIQEAGKVYSNQKIYIVADANKSNANTIKAGLEKSLKNPNIVIVNSALDIQPEQNMMTGQAAPVIAILASNNDALGTSFSNRLIQLASEVKGIKAFSMYYHPLFESKQDELGQVELVYLMDRKVTEGAFEKEVIADYKQKYCKTPPKYALIGFDIVNDILSRENKNGEVYKQINKVQTQVATKFEYVRAKSNGAYINTGYRVVRLIPEN